MKPDVIQAVQQALNDAIAHRERVIGFCGEAANLPVLDAEIVRLRATYNAACIAYDPSGI